MKKIVALFFIVVFLIMINGTCLGTEDIFIDIEEKLNNIDITTISKDGLLEIYDEIIGEYSPNVLAQALEDNKQELINQGVNEKIIDIGCDLIKATDVDELRDFIKNDINLEEIKKAIQEGDNLDDVIGNMITKPLLKKAFFTNKIIKNLVLTFIIILSYKIIIRGFIFKKAGEPFIFTFLPIFRDVVFYKICNMFPLIVFFCLFPIVGWLIVLMCAIARRFELAKVFKQNGFFALGLLILPTVFESIIAFNSNIRYFKNVSEDNFINEDEDLS